jgi:hypothetical protein
VTCFLTIAATDAAARLLGFRRTFMLTRRLSSSSSSRADAAVVEQTAHRVAVAAAFYPRRALCLEQSLALCILLQRRGIAAQMKLGVQARPFHAHAWVDIDGRAVNERAELVMRFATFAGLGG